MFARRTRGKVLRLASATVSVAMSISLVGTLGGAAKVRAYDEYSKDKNNTRLGTSQIKAPLKGTADNSWRGSYVWFGQYDDEPIKFRVLDPDTDLYGGKTMLLDSDKILYRSCFHNATSITSVSNTNNWVKSDIRKGLNGSAFLDKKGVFTDVEKAAIAESAIADHYYYDTLGNRTVTDASLKAYQSYTGLTGEKVFLLDAEDLNNTDYGYYQSDSSSIALPNVKEYDHNSADWWIRSRYVGNNGNISGHVSILGGLSNMFTNTSYGVAPALNIDQSKVLLSTAYSGTYGSTGTEYKLTLLDSSLNISMQSGRSAEIDAEYPDFVVFPIKADGDLLKTGFTCYSLLITDRDYQNDGARILLYEVIEGDAAGSYLPSFDWQNTGLDIDKWGTAYQVYILAEARNADKAVDRAGVPCKIDPPKISITKAEPTDNGVQIRWQKAPSMYRYNVYRSDSLDGTYTYIASVTDGSRKYVDKTAQGGKTYYYKVRAYTKVGGSTVYGCWSYPAKVTLLQDLSLTAEPKSGVTMKLSWTEVSGAQAYEIYRAASASGPYSYVKSTTGTSTSDTDRVAGTRYYYMVRAKRTVNGETQYSKYASAAAVALATPTLESAVYVSGSGVRLTWTRASGADRYNVYRYNTSTGKYDYVASVLGGTLTYTDASGRSGDYYKVRAYKRVDGVVYYGGWSNAKMGR